MERTWTLESETKVQIPLLQYVQLCHLWKATLSKTCISLVEVLIRQKQRGCRNKTMLSLVYKESGQIVIETEVDSNVLIISSYP